MNEDLEIAADRLTRIANYLFLEMLASAGSEDAGYYRDGYELIEALFAGIGHERDKKNEC